MAIIKATPHERLVMEAKRYRSYETGERVCDVIRYHREIFHPQNRLTIAHMRKLSALVLATIKLMEKDEEHVQELLDVLEKGASTIGEANAD